MVRASLALAAALLAGGQGKSTVTVSAAASLADVMKTLAELYETRTGERVILNLAASNTLARQIDAGARVDVFVSADETQMNALAALIVPRSRVDLLSNQLAIAVPDDRFRRFTSAKDLTDPAIRRIAIGDPDAVPAGVYARAYLQKQQLWDAVAAKLVPTGSVRLALAAVESGAADAAIVYKTDIAAARRAREAYVIPKGDAPPIVYPAALLRTGSNPAGGRRFLDLLESGEGSRIFARAGFLPLARDISR
jgi:molybdate transport system substrate-binding protein